MGRVYSHPMPSFFVGERFGMSTAAKREFEACQIYANQKLLFFVWLPELVPLMRLFLEKYLEKYLESLCAVMVQFLEKMTFYYRGTSECMTF